MSSIDIISPLSSKATALFPMLFVLGLSLIREGYEDYQKTSQDNLVNANITLRLEDGEWKPIRWDLIQVGDIIKV